MRSSVHFPTIASASSDSNDGIYSVNLYRIGNTGPYAIEVLLRKNSEEWVGDLVEYILKKNSDLNNNLLVGTGQKQYGMYFRGNRSDASECLRALGNSFASLNTIIERFLEVLELDAEGTIKAPEKPEKHHIASENIECVMCYCGEDPYDPFIEASQTCPNIHNDYLYHYSCISSWRKVNNSCPICRTNMLKKQIMLKEQSMLEKYIMFRKHSDVFTEKSLPKTVSLSTDSGQEDIIAWNSNILRSDIISTEYEDPINDWLIGIRSVKEAMKRGGSGFFKCSFQ